MRKNLMFRLGRRFRPVLNFLIEYGWLLFGWAFLVGVFARTGNIIGAIIAVVVWASYIEQSRTTMKFDIVKDFAYHLPGWIGQHIISMIGVLILMSRLNFHGFWIAGVLLCVTSPLLWALQIARWYPARSVWKIQPLEEDAPSQVIDGEQVIEN